MCPPESVRSQPLTVGRRCGLGQEAVPLTVPEVWERLGRGREGQERTRGFRDSPQCQVQLPVALSPSL